MNKRIRKLNIPSNKQISAPNITSDKQIFAAKESHPDLKRIRKLHRENILVNKKKQAAESLRSSLLNPNFFENVDTSTDYDEFESNDEFDSNNNDEFESNDNDEFESNNNEATEINSSRNDSQLSNILEPQGLKFSKHLPRKSGNIKTAQKQSSIKHSTIQLNDPQKLPSQKTSKPNRKVLLLLVIIGCLICIWMPLRIISTYSNSSRVVSGSSSNSTITQAPISTPIASITPTASVTPTGSVTVTTGSVTVTTGSVTVTTGSMPINQAKAVVQQYYDDINQKDYQTAYNLLSLNFKHALSFGIFKNGYLHDVHDAIVFVNIRQNSNNNITILLLLHVQTDTNLMHDYQWTAGVIKQNDNTWKIDRANLQRQ